MARMGVRGMTSGRAEDEQLPEEGTTRGAETGETRPVVLLVEDDRDALVIRKELFETGGFVAYGVQTAEAAKREVRAAPMIDIVVTDINLDPDSAFDTSGVDLAQYLRTEAPGLPIVGYSAVFAEGQLGQ